MNRNRKKNPLVIKTNIIIPFYLMNQNDNGSGQSSPLPICSKLFVDLNSRHLSKDNSFIFLLNVHNNSRRERVMQRNAHILLEIVDIFIFN